MKLGTNANHLSRHCWERFRGQRSRSQPGQMHLCCWRMPTNLWSSVHYPCSRDWQLASKLTLL